MATAAEIADLRLKIKEPNNTEPYTDEFLSQMIDTYTVRGASREIWQAKAASVAHLVDVSEGGSSRKMSDIHKNYLAIAKTFEDDTTETNAAALAPRSRRIERV